MTKEYIPPLHAEGQSSPATAAGSTPTHLIYLHSQGIVVHLVILFQLQVLFNTLQQNLLPHTAVLAAKLFGFDNLLKYSAKNRKF